MGSNLNVEAVQAAQGNYYIEEECPPETIGPSITVGLNSKNGIGGAGVTYALDFFKRGNVFDKQLNVRVEIAGETSENSTGYYGLGMEGTLFRNLSNEVSIYGSVGVDGRIGMFNPNIAEGRAHAEAYYSQTGVDLDISNSTVNAEAQGGTTGATAITYTDYNANGQVIGCGAIADAYAYKEIPKNYVDTQLALGIKYENESEGYLGLQFNVGTHTEVLPTASTYAYSDITQYTDLNGIVNKVDLMARAAASTRTKIETSPYFGGQVIAKGYITPQISYNLSGGLQVNPFTKDIRPFGSAGISLHTKNKL